MFKSAKTEMEKLIVDNNFHNFIASDLGKKAEEVNNWFKSFQYLDDTVKKAIAEKVYLDRKTLSISEYCINIYVIYIINLLSNSLSSFW